MDLQYFFKIPAFLIPVIKFKIPKCCILYASKNDKFLRPTNIKDERKKEELETSSLIWHQGDDEADAIVMINTSEEENEDEVCELTDDKDE